MPCPCRQNVENHAHSGKHEMVRWYRAGKWHEKACEFVHGKKCKNDTTGGGKSKKQGKAADDQGGAAPQVKKQKALSNAKGTQGVRVRGSTKSPGKGTPTIAKAPIAGRKSKK